MVKRFGFKAIDINFRLSSSSWQAVLEKEKDLPAEEYRKAVCFEFNLPLPNGQRYNRHKDMLLALEDAGLL